MKSKDSLCWWLKKNRLGLASASERRLQLLRQVGLNPEVKAVNLDETRFSDETVTDYVLRMAISKAQNGRIDNADLIIGADTVVVLKGELLGKPDNADHAKTMLSALSGNKHQVLTSVAVLRTRDGILVNQVVTTTVWVKPLTEEEILSYVATGEPLDKAGAYGIQGVGAFFVERLLGSYSGVVGLPLYETLELLRKLS